MHCVDMRQAVGIIGDFIDARTPHLVITLGVEMVMNAQVDAGFRDITQQAHLLTPDSIGVVWAARRQGHDCQRVPGIEMLSELAAEGTRRGWRLFFLGGKPGVADEAAARLQTRFPGLQVAGTADGYFKDEAAMIARVRDSKADILLAAMGSPRQETWCWKHRDALGVPVSIGVGGSFDVLAGTVKRAPRWMQRCHLEWLYRLLSNPSRAGRMLALPRFVCKVLLSGNARD
jgi:N-acetylglucosaminyldiphosphoundecaprenol N-acetyl-beta-D-mannosaminyltransferase